MLNGFRTIGAAAFWTLALGVAVSGSEAQETNTVGNPQLRDFQLPGPRTVQPPVQQPEAPATPAPAPQTPPATATPPATTPPTTAAPPTTTQPAPAPATRATPPPARTEPAAPRRTSPSTAPAPAPAPPEVQDALAVPGPAPAELQEALPQPPIASPAPVAPVEAPAAVQPVAAEPASGFPWLYLGLGAVALLLGFLAYRKLRSRGEEVYEEPEAVEESPAPAPVMRKPAPQPTRAPSPAPAPALAGGIVGIQVRPWLELEFKPDRAAASATEASLQYELTIRNTGNMAARDIRIEARMFNGGAHQEQEIGAFYAEPVRERTQPALADIAPRSEVKLRSSLVMPKENLREINVEGRRLFIPTVAFNVAYDWGENRSGQTSTSYVVGREAQAPSERMAPFRLDLGPRLYRSVGQRQTKLARIV